MCAFHLKEHNPVIKMSLMNTLSAVAAAAIKAAQDKVDMANKMTMEGKTSSDCTTGMTNFTYAVPMQSNSGAPFQRLSSLIPGQLTTYCSTTSSEGPVIFIKSHSTNGPLHPHSCNGKVQL